MGADQFAFLCKVIFDKLQLNKLWPWAEIKTVFLWGRFRQKYVTSFRFVESSIYSQQTKINPGSVLAAGSRGLLSFPWTCWSLSKLETCKVGKTSSTSSRYFNSLYRANKIWCFFQSLVPDQSITFIARAIALQW